MMTSSTAATQPAQRIKNNMSRCVISSLIALKLLQTVRSLVKALANVPTIAGWSQFVKPELQASQWWHKLWLDSGSPTAGVLFQIKKHCHHQYKYAVRPVRRRQDHIKSAKLAEALLQSPNCNFCSEVHQFSGNKKPSPSPVVDIFTGSDNIANLFSNNLKQLSNSTDSSASAELLDNLESALTSTDIEHVYVSPEVIQGAIGKLKCGKVVTN